MIFQLFKTIEEVDSPINGKIKVVKDLQGIRLIVGGVSQSGWSMKSVWKKGLYRIKDYLVSPDRVLILGLGGGSAAEVVTNIWNNTNITGVDIDASMVDLGKKYLKLGKIENIKFVITDAYRWVLDNQPGKVSQTREKRKKARALYDLILVDVYRGDRIPDAFRREVFLKAVKNMLTSYGIVAYNHLYGPSDKENAKNLQKMLRKIYPKVVAFYPSSNVIFICFPEVKSLTKTTSLR